MKLEVSFSGKQWMKTILRDWQQSVHAHRGRMGGQVCRQTLN